jgi:histidyl-tRNA synthetase
MTSKTENQLITPRTLKGFRDYLPAVMQRREWMMDTARRVYRSYGFVPIETPALELFEILTGKGSEETDRQMYHFTHGDRHVGLRFDLTVPLARFVAQHVNELGLPFKRYQIAPVWRGENPQAGRYREFTQCDFDTIGTEGVVADIETISVARDLLAALGIQRFQIRINSRQVLAGLLAEIGAGDRSTSVLRALDKFDKLGEEVVTKELQTQAGLEAKQIDAVLRFAKASGDNFETLARLQDDLGNNSIAAAGIERLRAIVQSVESTIDGGKIVIDTRIARGLDYYTGVVFETILTDLPSIGSVCSGGRYDNLAGLYTKQHLPGIGGSLGLDRLLTALEQMNVNSAQHENTTIFVAYFDADRLSDYLQISQILRNAGMNVELYPESKKLGQQLKFADSRGFPIAVIAGSDELARGCCQLKDLRHKLSSEVKWREHPELLIDSVQTLLNLPPGTLLS